MKTSLLLLLSTLAFNTLAASPVWLVQGKSTKLYLAGTVHILRDSDYPLPDAFEQAYAQSQQLAFEVDIAQTRAPKFMQMMADSVQLPAGTSLQQLLKPQTLDRLARHLRNNGLSLQPFEGMKPAIIATTLTMIELQKMGVSSEGVDSFYYHKARADGKTVLALESAEQQIRYLANMGKGHEDLMIQQTLDDIKSLTTDFNNMLQGWRSGDTKKLQQLFIDSLQQDFEPIYRELLVQRNLDWMPHLLGYLESAPIEMVLVGSAHLIGEHGLLQMLRQQGYRVTQLD